MTRKLIRNFSGFFLFLLFFSLRTNGSIDVADVFRYVRQLVWRNTFTPYSDNNCRATVGLQCIDKRKNQRKLRYLRGYSWTILTILRRVRLPRYQCIQSALVHKD